MFRMISFVALLSLLSFLIYSPVAKAEAGESLKTLGVQDAGRIKPFDTFSRELLSLVHGKEKFEGRPAYLIVMTWLLDPVSWQDKKMVEIKHNEVKSGLKFPIEEKYFSVDQIIKNERLPLLMQELQSKRETKEKLDPYYQAVERLESQLYVLRHISNGQYLRLAPPLSGDTWVSLDQLTPEQSAGFQTIAAQFMGVLSTYTEKKSKEESKQIEERFAKAVEDFKALVKAQNPAGYANQTRVDLEVHYNNFHPFKYSWIFYILSAVLSFMVWILSKDKLLRWAWVTVIIGMIFHVYGFALRSYLMERAPVANMYETVVWVGFGAVLFALILEGVYKFRFTLLAGGLVGAFCLILGDMAPAVLDDGFHPLEPVLRSNYWLTVHVLTITISYAAFFLAFVLSDIGLIYILKGEQKYMKDKIQPIAQAVYRSIQIGVVFLAPGIILGGIWADYSWGRFWGWDPKETWALIALLGYLAVLHGRLVGWVKNFSMLVCGVISFSLVIMAWYGVNYVLGAGLHSYGFGAGGVEYVTAFVVAHILYVIFVTIVRRDQLKKSS